MREMKLALCAMLVVAGCSKKDDDANAQTNRPAAGAPVAADPRAQGGPAGQGGGGGAGGGRRNMSVTLAAADVASVVRMPIERSIAITGELRPIDRVEIRARQEGDLLDVYVREGQRVGVGAILARFESFSEEGNVQSAEADRASARSAFTTAQWNLDQTKELFKEGAIPERDLRAAEQQVASARAQLAASEARLRSVANSLRDTRVTAPVAGVIETRTAAPGEHVPRGAQLFSLVRNDALELAATVPAAQAGALAVGQTIRFSAGGRAVIGKISRISPTVDPTSRAVKVYVNVPNRDGSMRGGTFATGRLVLSTNPSAITIPAAAVRFSAQNNQPFVYRIAAGKLEQANVRVGYSDPSSGMVEVVSGLEAGDKIVVGNVGTLGKGMKVQIVGGENARGPKR
ncbi:MAG TPA: efflux RND transporter periplasmic adaptor subunit [Longimicrobiales bacterium]|nr:efflux RND transporter periplasmic adaptor subunit [Longimicrobiales bacterium]